MNILMVENHEVFAKTVAGALLAEHNVIVVPTLRAARQALLARGPFHAVLVDYDLDDGKGDDLVRWLASRSAQPPTIGISSHDAGNTALLNAGAVEICPKMRFSDISRFLDKAVASRPVAATRKRAAEIDSFSMVEGLEDRVLVRRIGSGTLVLVADGAGGSGRGAQAADQFINSVDSSVADRGGVHDPLEIADVLHDIDQMIATTCDGGETTGVVVMIQDGELLGASVGDSEAHLQSGSSGLDLTKQQRRKPLLGSGQAIPVAFGPVSFRGTLISGTDGVFSYANRDIIQSAAGTLSLVVAAKAIAESARLPSGELQDDIGLVLLRQTED